MLYSSNIDYPMFRVAENWIIDTVVVMFRISLLTNCKPMLPFGRDILMEFKGSVSARLMTFV